MKITIDKAGRIVIPKDIRTAAGLRPGMELEVRCQDGRIEIEPRSTVRLVRRGRFLVAVSDEPAGSLPPDIVERTREAILRERFPYVE